MAINSSILAWKIPRDRRAWWTIVHGVTKNQTLLSYYEQHMDMYDPIIISLIVLGLFSVNKSSCFLPREIPLAFVVRLVWWC